MDKTILIELLARKMAGEATPDELQQLSELMISHPDAVYYEEVLYRLWQNPADEGFVPDIEQAYVFHRLKFHQDFETEAAIETVSASYSYKNLIACVLLLVVAFLVCLTLFNPRINEVQHIEIVSGKGIRKKLKLPDGTLVWLNAGSKLSYASNFAAKKVRSVFLSGEAFFDVAHHASQSFVVHTDKISIKVLGTAFNIQAYPREDKAEATLLRGSIELSVNDGSGQKVILSPSEKFAFKKEKQSRSAGQRRVPRLGISMMINPVVPVKIGKEEYIEETSWKDNRMVFKNETLKELKPKLERWFNVRIIFRADKPGEYRFTGILEKENIAEALTAMQLIKPFTYKLKANDVIIY